MLLGDFYIVDVEYDPNTGLACRIKICEPVDARPGPAFWASREQIIQLIDDGYTVEPLPDNEALVPYRKLIRLIYVGGQVFMRTDETALPADKLDVFSNGPTGRK